MNPGSLDRRIAIERATKVKDAFGGEQLTWATVAEVWAQYTPVSDSERLRAAQVQSKITARFLVRYDAALAITVEDRVVFGGRTLGLDGIKEIGRRQYWELTVKGEVI